MTNLIILGNIESPKRVKSFRAMGINGHNLEKLQNRKVHLDARPFYNLVSVLLSIWLDWWDGRIWIYTKLTEYFFGDAVIIRLIFG